MTNGIPKDTLFVTMHFSNRNLFNRASSIQPDTTPSIVNQLGLETRLRQANRQRASQAIASTAAANNTAKKIPLKGSYNLTVTGVTLVGDTNIPYSYTNYTPIEGFTLPGRLVVNKTLPRGQSPDNGKNVREIGILVGTNPLLGVGANPQAGAAWFATNPRLFRQAGGNIGQTAPADVAYVDINAKEGAVRAIVDFNAAQTVPQNSFNWRTSLFAAPKQVLVGDMQLQFRNNGKRVTGFIRVYGSSLAEAGAYGYRASFTGTRRNNQASVETQNQ
jgi:hypothetical protein